MKYSKIIGTGAYLPSKILSNKDLEKIFDTSDEWIQTRTGISQRHIIGENERTSDLAYQAALDVLKNSSIDPAEIDLILVATTTPDKVFPSVACAVQRKLNIKNIPAFDIQAVCSGFIFALTTADSFIKSGTYKKILVIGADSMSSITDYKDRSNAILWGDGAGAVILSASNEPGIIRNIIHSNGEYEELLHVPRKSETNDPNTIEMQGNAVFKIAVNTLDQIVDETLSGSGFEKKDIDWLVPHQANIRILQATAKKLEMSMDKVIVTIDKHGNTSAASIPLALNEGIRSNRVKAGNLILMEAFGGGFTWGSSLIRI
jgi:3-oxoacyl-[acyl-carrier-protein] synthase-3